MAPMDDDPADVQEQATLGALWYLSKKGQRVEEPVWCKIHSKGHGRESSRCHLSPVISHSIIYKFPILHGIIPRPSIAEE